MNTLYTTCLCFLVSLKQSFSLLECDEYKFDTKKGYCEIPDYDKYQIPPYPPLKVNISLGNMVNFKFLAYSKTVFFLKHAILKYDEPIPLIKNNVQLICIYLLYLLNYGLKHEV